MRAEVGAGAVTTCKEGAAVTSGGGRTGAMTGTVVCAGTSSEAWSSVTVFLDFLRLEIDVPRVLLSEEPVFLPPLRFPAFPGVGSGETGVESTSMLKIGSPSSSNKIQVLTVHSG